MSDTKLCWLLVAVGIYVETLGRCDASHITNTAPLFGDSENGDRIMFDNKALQSLKFCKMKAGNLGMYITPKDAGMYGRCTCLQRDFVNHRAIYMVRLQTSC